MLFLGLRGHPQDPHQKQYIHSPHPLPEPPMVVVKVPPPSRTPNGGGKGGGGGVHNKQFYAVKLVRI